MSERPWSTQPITGAQHDAWMAQEVHRPTLRVRFADPNPAGIILFEEVRSEFSGPREHEPVILDEDGAARDFTRRYLRSIRSM